jgi:RNA polymerase sigma-70 factor, ECF subfamily
MAESGQRAPGVESAAALYRAHATFVANFLAKLGVPGQEVEDATQDVFLTAHRRGGFTPGPAKATTWLAEIALRVASDRRRARGRRGSMPDTDHVERAGGEAATPESRAELSESLAWVDRALAAVDLEHRAVFVLFELEGESCADIAAGLGIAVGTVHSRLHTARRTFRNHYERLLKTQARYAGEAP